MKMGGTRGWCSNLLFFHIMQTGTQDFGGILEAEDNETQPRRVRVDGVMGAFFLIRRSVILPPALFDEDFFFFYEDTALAHTLKNRGVPCFIIPDATVIHIGGKSRSADSISFFYDSKYLYLKKFYGPFHARAVYLMDRARILRKWMFYSLFSLVTASERIKSKQRYYKIAWGNARLR